MVVQYQIEMTKTKEKLWTRDYALAFFAGFFNALIVSTMLTLMAVYSMGKFGVSEGLAGFTASIAMVGCVIGRLFAGTNTERIGRRKMAMWVNILNVLCCGLYLLPITHVGPFLAIRLLHGVMLGTSHNTLATVALDFIPSSRRTEGLAIYTLNFTVALAVGPALGIVIATKWSYMAFFAANLIFAVAGLIVTYLIRFAPTLFTEEQMARPKLSEGFSAFFEKSAMPLSLTILLLSMCYTGATAFIETYVDSLGVGWIASIFFIIYSLSIIMTRPFAGRLADRRGENFVLVPAIIFYAISLLLLGLAGLLPSVLAPALIIATSFIMALGFGSILPTGYATAIKYGQPHRYTKITSTYYIFSDGAMGIGALVFGLIASKAGFSITFFIAIAFILGGLIIYWTKHGRFHR